MQGYKRLNTNGTATRQPRYCKGPCKFLQRWLWNRALFSVCQGSGNNVGGNDTVNCANGTIEGVSCSVLIRKCVVGRSVPTVPRRCLFKESSSNLSFCDSRSQEERGWKQTRLSLLINGYVLGERLRCRWSTLDPRISPLTTAYRRPRPPLSPV